MGERVVSAAVLVAVVGAVFLLGQPWLAIAVAVLSFVAATEAFSLLQAADVPVSPGIGIIAAPIAALGTLAWAGEPALPVAFFVGLIVLAAMAALRHRDPRTGFLDWSGSTFGALYVSLLAFVPGIVAVAPAVAPSAPLAGVFDAGRIWLLVLVLTVWSFDTCAYLVGRALPRGRLLARISPHKTWSGVIGGTVAAGGVCALLVWGAGHHPLGGVALGLLIAITAQAGDIAESMLKRAAGAKDSGTLIPGHGGILDRIDSFLFAAPVTYVALTTIALFTVARPA